MKTILKDNKGINLVSLAVAITIIVIVTTMLVYNAKDVIHIKALTNLYNDIAVLREKISSYYNDYGNIPAKDKYQYSDKIEELKYAEVIGANDDENEFYIIDLKAIENLTLNYGKDYEKILDGSIDVNNESDVRSLQDLYIINKNSHNIFYVKGVTIQQDGEDKIYYTDAEPAMNNEEMDSNRNIVDTVKVNLRYVEGIKIPDNCLYVSGSKQTGIIVKDEENVEYTWQVLEEKINELPENVTLDSEKQSEEQFLESANAYNGYYLQNSEGNKKVIYLELEDEWSDVYDEKGIYVDEDENSVYIPKGFKISTNPTMNKVNSGLVIKEESTGNEYVWIDVPKPVTRVTATADNDYENIYQDLKNYASNFRESGYNDQWYEGCGLTNEQYNNLKNNMLSSIYKNGGFYIGRYEAGVNNPKTRGVATETVDTLTSVNGLPLSNQDKYPYIYVTCAQAQGLAGKVSDGKEYTSSLMFGIQWDLVCKFIQTNGLGNNIQNNNENWGNFKNSNFTVARGKYISNFQDQIWNNVDNQYPYEKTNGMEILLTAGATKRNSVLNIYDFAGNTWEWTLENRNSGNPAVYRGACCHDESNTYKVTSRGLLGTTVFISGDVGFRISIY